MPSPSPFSTTSKAPSPLDGNGPPPPSSILIVGAGVFGLSTALSLARNPALPSSTRITVLDRSPQPGVFPSRDASSIDTSRIIRADYADPAYAALAAEAQEVWRRPDGCGADGRYNECGLIITTDDATARKSSASGGVDYARSSWENVKALAADDPTLSAKIEELPSPEAIRAAYGTGGGNGSWGYINRRSGWADAEACMDWLHAQVRATGRVRFINGTAASLACSTFNRRTPQVRGVRLTDGSELTADLTVLATGAWTPGLIDLSRRAVATGQVVAYMDLTDEEQASLEGIPTLLNLSTGYFIITPSNKTLKVARHSYGYLNPTPTPTPAGGQSKSVISAPATHLTTPPTQSIPPADEAALRAAMCEMVPHLPGLRERPFRETKLCWYTDTVDGDFIIDYHPDYRSLFLATGGSGHGFKFLPVIGDHIAATLFGNCPQAFRGKWSFRKDGSERAESWDKVVTADGSRGGVPGLILREEMERRDLGKRTSRL
ncbi:putative fructosyl amino acid protein [Diaporthe sp. PMI_573]|nr:putative fructosyl amino acid protein [Diaporthaceae sp. PMI_573]